VANLLTVSAADLTD